MNRLLARGTTFVLAAGFALLPALGPFVALLLFISARLRTRRQDLLWAGAGLLLCIAPIASGRFDVAGGTLLQVAAGWLIYRAFEDLAPLGGLESQSSSVSAGLLTGLGLVIWFQLANVEAVNFESAKTIAHAIVWQSSPALFGHTVLVLGGVVLITSPGTLVRICAIGLSAFGILISGSIEASLGWLVLVIAVLTVQRATTHWQRAMEGLLVAVVAAIAVGLGPLSAWGEVGFLVQPTPGADRANLLYGTEIPAGDWWDDSWVDVATTDVTIGSETMVAYRVQKTGAEGWLRLQQSVTLAPDTEYTVSTWLRGGHEASRPGIQGWGESIQEDRPDSFIVAGALRDGSWTASVLGPGTMLDAGIADAEDPWIRAFVTFRYEGTEAIRWHVGVVPDSRPLPGGVAEFAGFQLQVGEIGPYQPGPATRGLGLDIARTPLWRAAWQGILERPWLGWGPAAFPEYYLRDRPTRDRLHVLPDHAHNLLLQTWFERGLVGVLGLALFLAALARPAALRRDRAFLALLAAVLLANGFDTTLLYGGVFYPLIAIAGWRTGNSPATNPSDSARAANVLPRFGLALADVTTVLVTYVIGVWIASRAFPGMGQDGGDPAIAAAYLLLLWPLTAWREGLYPGYGLTPQQELAKQVSVAVQAGLAALLVTLLVPQVTGLSVPSVSIAIMGTVVTLPLGRAAMKRILLTMGQWGRRVIVMGAGATGSRIVRGLMATPLDGLHPVACFDDDPSLHRQWVHGVPVVGALAQAPEYARRYEVHHAIVAIPSLPEGRLREVLDTHRRQFRIVQHIPGLPGLPAEGVSASNLDGMLAIEVRNNLASQRNRVFKRIIDVAGALGCVVPLAPLFVALAIWIRIDSRGSPIYRSERIGQDGRPFMCLKFRTMHEDAERDLAHMVETDASVRAEYERFHKLADDPRVTRAGRWLRRWSLDELPQLFNVLGGSMSLVGPRPYLTRELPHMCEYGDIILQAKPGMTGYWQVSERNDVSFRDRLEMEAHYVRNWSIWWDIVILVRTLPAVLEKRGR